MASRRALIATALGAPMVALPGAAWAQRASTAGPGVRVVPDRLAMPGLARERGLRLYLPPSYATSPDRRYPAIYMHDAQNLFDDATSFVGEWGVDETLDELARTTGFEAIVVGIDHGGERRIAEMLPWPIDRFPVVEGAAYIDFIARTVKPWIDARWRTRPDVASTAIAGSSIAGSISHYALLRHPDVFGKAGLFSPSYWSTPELFDWARQSPAPAAARLYLHVGGAELPVMREPAERMQALLRTQRAASTLSVVPGADHNETAWRSAFGPAVRWLFELA
jgi:predicted alpha/beta superfamily hydrolase